VGFDLYTKLLDEAVRESTGEPVPTPAVEPTITVEAEALLPEEYIPEVSQRLALYKKLADVARVEEIGEVKAELLDRFGPPPPPVESLLDVVALRVAARSLGVERLEARGGRALVTFAPSTPVPPDRILSLIARGGGELAMKREYTLEARIPEGPWPAVRTALGRLMQSLVG
jgi:transcription-repair coupling factor (superfamily II helicase)